MPYTEYGPSSNSNCSLYIGADILNFDEAGKGLIKQYTGSFLKNLF